MKIDHEIQSPDEAEEIISTIKNTISSGINVGLGPYWRKWVADLVCWMEDGNH